MADAVTSKVLINSKHRYVVVLTNVSDGTGESDVVKIDKSTLVNLNGVEPTKLNLVSVQWAIGGFSSVRLEWDHTADDMCLALPTGTGYFDFSCFGAYSDPASAGTTGDILLTTAGAVSGATYSIVLEFFMSGNS
jgi:hypothetical protein